MGWEDTCGGGPADAYFVALVGGEVVEEKPGGDSG